MYQSPRMRRLRNDRLALERLRTESSVFRFGAHGDPPHQYNVLFQGRGLWRDRGKVRFHETHRIEIKLGASYPRTMPEIRWLTPIYHPNISEIGMVCLGGYGTHWVPSVQLDELCIMLWDMLRYHNYDIRSPYNRDAALWVASQTAIRFPTDMRPLRDLRAALGRVAFAPTEGTPDRPNGTGHSGSPDAGDAANTPVDRVRRFAERYRRRLNRGPEAEMQGPAPQAVAAPSDAEIPGLVATDLQSTPEERTGVVPDRDETVVILQASSPAPVERAEPQPESDEIIFIE
jgi:ubiquitin-protein ligase